MKDSWGVIEIVDNNLRILESHLDENEAKSLAQKYNAIGDYTYEAIPLIIRTDNISSADLDRIYQRLSSRLR